ncbi:MULTISPECIES: TetR/AcrR family transcriptional regulator [unclassified Ruegeria]|uniref:TetR/AcrR family transcriptional regulator n=1 Tax=unclassified Ruegeria TaxID=2625375 RepID=UPI00148955E0|nr:MULTISPECIES: TetR-like C-terminal domain-containing protein [unclassified Ruegeria]
MTTKTQIRRQQLREKLVEAAEIRIARDGLSELRARDLAKDAGCAVGAIYNAYEDLTAIAMAVNGRTFLRLEQAVGASFDGTESPVERLIVMSTAYLHFANAHTNLWRALFDLQMADDSNVPDWYREALKGLFAYIAEPARELFPDLDRAEMDLMTRALFSSVHGIVTLGLENRISGVPPEQIERMIAQVLSRIGNK